MIKHGPTAFGEDEALGDHSGPGCIDGGTFQVTDGHLPAFHYSDGNDPPGSAASTAQVVAVNGK